MQSAFTSLLLLLPLWAFSQSCPDFDRLMREGDQAKDYEIAFKKYDAADAVACTEALREQARAKKSELFKKINALRRKAEKAQIDTKRAEAAARMSAQHTYMAMQALEEEQQKTLIEKNNALEALRLAQLMSDSAARANEKIRLANESVVMLIQMNDMEALGNIALEKDDFEGARAQYAEVVRRIDLVPVKDSSLLRKGMLIREKIKTLDDQKDQASTFHSILHQGDSLRQLGVLHFGAAIEHYLYAGKLNWRSEVVCERLKAVEADLQQNWPATKKLKVSELANLMGISAQGLKFCGKQLEAVMRIQKACRLSNDDLSFVQDPDLRLVAWKYNQRFARRTTLYLGIRYLFRQQSDRAIVKVDNRSLDGQPKPDAFTEHIDLYAPTLVANLEPNVDFSVFYKLSNAWQVGAGFNFRQYVPKNYITGAFVSKIDPSLTESYFIAKNEYRNKLNFYVLASHRNATIVTARNKFSTQLLVGIDFNTTNRIAWRSLYFWSNNFTLSQENFNYDFSTGNFEGSLHSNPQTGECTVYLDYPPVSNSGMDAMIGLRLKWQPFRKLGNLGFYCDAFRRIYIFQPGRGRNTYNLADELHGDLDRNNHGLSAGSVAALKTYFTNNFDLDITLDESRRQFLNRYSVNAGVYYLLQ